MLDIINSSGFAVGAAALIFNMGMRTVFDDLGHIHSILLSSQIFRIIVVFCMFFVPTRNVHTAAILTAVYISLFTILLHEDSFFSLIPESIRRQIALKKSLAPSIDDYIKARSTVTAFETYHKKQRGF